MKQIKLKAYAKVNLYLEVSKLLPNNYHYLHMLNARVTNFYDDIYIKENKCNKIVFSNKYQNQIPSNNICQRILDDFTNKYNLNKHYYIYIRKRIPLGSGLGGGSMDAATIYQFLLKDNHINLSIDEQINFLIQYGADIPYGLFDSLCYVEGIGENITILDNKLLNNKLYLILPNIHISTKEIFDQYNYYHEPLNKEEVINSINEDINKLLINDLETVTLQNKNMFDIKNYLNSLGPNVMSGSGSSFLLFTEKLKFKDKKALIKKNTKILQITIK